MIAVLLVITFSSPSVTVSQRDDFPIGLTLTYDTDERLNMHTYSLGSLTVEVLDKINDDVYSMILTDSDGTHSVNVHLPEWRALYENGSVFKYLDPLWMNITHWKVNDNVSIGSEGLFNLIESRTEETPIGDFYCWTGRQSYHVYAGTDSFGRAEHYYYNHDHGLLIQHWTYSYGDENRETTTLLVASNIGEFERIYTYPQTSLLEVALILGIGTEIVIIGYLLHRRYRKR